jgi:hypothetical protein
VRQGEDLSEHAAEALADLRQDFGELLYLARDAAAELAASRSSAARASASTRRGST